MKMVFILLLLVSCRSPGRKVNNNALHFVPLKSDAITLTKVNNLVRAMSLEEKTVLANGYLKYFRYAMRQPCLFTETFSPGPGLPRLGIPPLNFLEINRQNPNQLNASFLDLSTSFAGEQYFYFGREADLANEAFFKTPLPLEPKPNRYGFDLLLMRSGYAQESKFVICALHYQKKNLCVEDSLTKELVDINNQDKFCAWLSEHKTFMEKDLDQVAFKLIQTLGTIEVITLDKK